MAQVEILYSPAPPPVFVLTLSTAEAQYVHAALMGASPTRFDGGVDPVWEALSDVLVQSGVGTDPGAAS